MIDVSRETYQKLEAYAQLLTTWTKKINLISASSVPDLWKRHIEDSVQLYNLGPPEWRRWLDLGSGGGLPGLVIAILADNNPDREVVLVESDARKCAFLRSALRETGTSARVVHGRIERLDPFSADVVSARALASLTDLLGYAERHLSAGGTALFLKGQKAHAEIDEALERWTFACENHPSETDASGVILSIGDVKRA
ncbi:MAG: 16S rRNA (guanine(527)-N(7))-methyltransferase RsmG [Pseudomonadota bacterium]